MNLENLREKLFYLFVFLLPWQTVFLVREIFVGGEKWQYGTIGIYLSDIVLVLIFLANIKTIFNFQFFNSHSIFNDKIFKLKNKLEGKIQKSKERKVWKLSLARLIENCKLKIENFEIKNRFKKILVTGYGLLVTNKKAVIICFLLWSVLSIAWSDDKLLAAYFSLKILLGIGLFFVIQKINFDFRKLVFVLLFSAVIQSGLGMWQYLSQDSFSSKWLGISNHLAWQGGTSVVENESGRWLRAYGGFEHPNILGGFLVLTLLVSVKTIFNFQFSNFHSIFNDKNDKILKPKLNFASYWLLVTSYWLLATSYLLITFGILFSFSRSAWLALIVGMVILANSKIIFNFQFSIFHSILNERIFKLKNKSEEKIKKSKEEKVWKLSFEKLIENCKLKIENSNSNLFYLATISVIVIGLVIATNSNNFSSRFDVGERLEKKSVSDRMEYALESKKVIENNFLAGAGVGSYTLEVMKNDNFQKQIWKYQPVHNFFLLIFSELGLVGIILFVLFLTQVLSKANPESYPIFGALFVFMIFDHWLWTSHFGMLFFWMTLGLSLRKDKI